MILKNVGGCQYDWLCDGGFKEITWWSGSEVTMETAWVFTWSMDMEVSGLEMEWDNRATQWTGLQHRSHQNRGASYDHTCETFF